MANFSLGAIGDNLKQNAGVIEKAVIEVIDLGLRNAPAKEDAPEVQKKKVGGSAGAMSNLSTGDSLVSGGLLTDSIADMQFNKVAGKYAQMVKDGKMTGEQVKKIKDEFVERAEQDKEKYANAGRKYFTVQFNPSSLQLSGHAGGLVQRLSYDKEDKDHDGKDDQSASYTKGNTTIIMSVSLLFDSCDPQDAFLDDKMSLNPVNVGKGLVKAGMAATGNKEISIQTKVEGFIAALRNPRTRILTFNWGNICYSGVLRSVGVNYTMFNPNGEPIRATVDLSLVCADDDQWPNSLSVWQIRYANAFEKGSESFVKTEQKVGSLLSL